MLRLALICDYTQERWTSMDVVADMLLDHISLGREREIQVDRLRPEWKPRATAVSGLRGSHLAWNADRLCNRMADFPWFLRQQRSKYDLFHIVDHSYAHLALSLPPGKTVITCHDLDAFSSIYEPANQNRPLWFRLIAQRILKGFRHAAHVFFVSEAVMQQAISLNLVVKEISSVVSNGVLPVARFDPEAECIAERLLGHHGHGPLLLSVGSTMPRKRIDVVLQVFAGVMNTEPAARLVRLGEALTDEQRALAMRLGIANSIVEIPFVSRAVLSALYKKSTVLLQPSDSEGFGLPVAEAMACGCPVVASDIPVLRETGGSAAVYCMPGDVEAWTDQVINLLRNWRETPSLRIQSGIACAEHASRFSWHAAADQLVEVYQRVARKSCQASTFAHTPAYVESA